MLDLGQPNSPCADQTLEAVASWLKAHVQLGTDVVIRHTQAGLLQYERARVVRLGRGRFEVGVRRLTGEYDPSGPTFYYSGKHCFHPKGQTRLVIPTTSVLAACDVCQQGRGFLPGGPYAYRPAFY